MDMTDLDSSAGLTPGDMAGACGVSIDTLRYYEREGLLDPISRTGGGQRRYNAHDVAWVEILRCLRVTALPIREMRRFAELVRAGDDGIPERLALLQRHRTSVLAQIVELQRALSVVDHKIEIYSQLTAADGHPSAALPDCVPQPPTGT